MYLSCYECSYVCDLVGTWEESCMYRIDGAILAHVCISLYVLAWAHGELEWDTQ